MLPALDAVVSAQNKLKDIQERVKDAEEDRDEASKNVTEAQKNLEQASNNVALAEQKLKEAKDEAVKVTLEEKLAIAQQEEAIRKLADIEREKYCTRITTCSCKRKIN